MGEPYNLNKSNKRDWDGSEQENLKSNLKAYAFELKGRRVVSLNFDPNTLNVNSNPLWKDYLEVICTQARLTFIESTKNILGDTTAVSLVDKLTMNDTYYPCEGSEYMAHEVALRYAIPQATVGREIDLTKLPLFSYYFSEYLEDNGHWKANLAEAWGLENNAEITQLELIERPDTNNGVIYAFSLQMLTEKEIYTLINGLISKQQELFEYRESLGNTSKPCQLKGVREYPGGIIGQGSDNVGNEITSLLISLSEIKPNFFCKNCR